MRIDGTDLGVAAAWPSANARELFGLRLFLANRHGGMGIIDSVKAGRPALWGWRQSTVQAQRWRNFGLGGGDLGVLA